MTKTGKHAKMNRMKKSILAGFGGALFATLTAQATIVTFTLTGTVTTPGPWLGTTGTGSFSYDDAVITGTGTEELAPPDSLTLEFTIFGQTFNETDDVDYDEYPILSFENGVPTELDFLVSETGDNPVAIDEPGISNIFVGFELDSDSTGGFETDVEVKETPVPEVSGSAYALLSAAGLGLFLVRRRRQRQN